MRDPIVDEIHRLREKRSAKFKHNLHAMFADLRRSEKKSKARGAKFVIPKPRKRKTCAIDIPDSTRKAELPRPEPTGDPIVDEVRRVRDKIAARFGYSIEAIAEDARKRQATSGHRVVNLSQPSGKRLLPATRKARRPLRKGQALKRTTSGMVKTA